MLDAIGQSDAALIHDASEARALSPIVLRGASHLATSALGHFHGVIVVAGVSYQ